MMKRRRRGLSLLECIICIAILIVIASFLGSSRVAINKASVMHEGERIACVLEAARAQAAATGVATEVLFDVVHGTYQFGSAHFTLPEKVRFGVKKGVRGPPANPSKAIKEPITFAGNRASFSDAGVSSAGTIYLVDTTRQQQAAISCGVGQFTRIRIYTYKDKWHELDA